MSVIPVVCVVALLALLGLCSVATHSPGPSSLGAVYVAFVSVPLTSIDVRHYRLPNMLVLPGMVAALVGVLLAHPSGADVAPLVFIPLLVLLSGLIGWSTMGLGMGDVKLTVVLALVLTAELVGSGRTDTLVLRLGVWSVLVVVVAALIGVGELIVSRQTSADIALGPVLLSTFWCALAAP